MGAIEASLDSWYWVFGSLRARQENRISVTICEADFCGIKRVRLHFWSDVLDSDHNWTLLGDLFDALYDKKGTWRGNPELEEIFGKNKSSLA